MGISMVVENIMRREVVTAFADEPVIKVAHLMLEKNVRSVVIIDKENKPVGIITDTDVLFRGIGSCNLYETPIKKIMTPNPLTASPTDNVLDIVKIMEEKKFRRMPVVNGDGILIGIISIGDIAPQVMIQLELLRDSL